MPRPRAGGVLGNGVRPCSEVLARGVLLEGIAYMGGIARTFPVLWLLFSFTKSPPARKFVGGRSGSGTTRPRARPRAECSTDSRCRSKPVVMAPQCKPRNGRAPSTPRVSSSSPQVRPAAVVPPRSVSSGKHSSAAESPASAPFSTLTFTYSQPLRAHMLLRLERCTLPHICAALVYDFGWESHVQTTHCVASPPQLHACCVYVSYTDTC